MYNELSGTVTVSGSRSEALYGRSYEYRDNGDVVHGRYGNPDMVWNEFDNKFVGYRGQLHGHHHSTGFIHVLCSGI
jgi:hypothetical protein